jgi:capsular polysaccharide transport system ATP-binding protein
MPIATYSSGMRSRISFGLSMAIDFDCYLVDEALSVGDGVFRARAEALFEAKAKTANLIIVSHNPGTVSKYCDMGAVLSNGELLLFDKLDDAVAHYQKITNNLGNFE